VPVFIAWEKVRLCMIDSAEANIGKMNTALYGHCGSLAMWEVDTIVRKNNIATGVQLRIIVGKFLYASTESNARHLNYIYCQYSHITCIHSIFSKYIVSSFLVLSNT
jgi:hypothetical protein